VAAAKGREELGSAVVAAAESAWRLRLVGVAMAVVAKVATASWRV